MSLPELSDEQRQTLERVRADWDVAEKEHKFHRQRWDGFYRQYHSYTDFKRSHSEASPRDKDGVVRDGQREWGATLYIPYTYTVVETIVPRMLSNRPRMLWLPGDKDSARNTENMRWLLDRQQEQLNYELRLQTTAKTGLICGLGVRKTGWRREVATRKRLAPMTLEPGKYQAVEYQAMLWDDPYSEDVDIYDFLWDPMGDSVETCGYLFHRAWRTTDYVLKMIRSREWDLLPEDVVQEDLHGSGKGRYDEVWAGRKQAQGLNKAATERCIHEVWEYHNGAEVITVLDRERPVRHIANPAWHMEKPFHVYRPTEVPHCMVGKGEPEPISDLQAEMNTLRSQRRDNAALKLQQSWFYEIGSLDPQTVRFGPGMLVGVNPQGSLRDALVPMQVGDIPLSGYQEAQALQEDIERTTGVSDQTAGAGMQQETATGAQLVQAAANVRIQLKTRRLELEVAKPEAQHFVWLNQQYIVANRTVRVPQVPQPGQPDSVWAWREVGPVELAGTWDIEPEGGATAPENVPQDRQDGAQLDAVFGHDPNVDHRKLTGLKLEKFGIKRPESYMVPENFVPPQFVEIVAQGMEEQGALPKAQVEEFLRQALDLARRQMEGTPSQSLQAPEEPAGAEGQPAAQGG